MSFFVVNVFPPASFSIHCLSALEDNRTSVRLLVAVCHSLQDAAVQGPDNTAAGECPAAVVST